MSSSLGTATGDRVRLVQFGDAADDAERGTGQVPPGTLGTVTHIDAQWTLHVHWDNGCDVNLLHEVDEWHPVSGGS